MGTGKETPGHGKDDIGSAARVTVDKVGRGTGAGRRIYDESIVGCGRRERQGGGGFFFPLVREERSRTGSELL